MLRDRVIFNNCVSLLQIHCYGCGSFVHIIENCNSIHYLPDKNFIIKKYLFSVPIAERKNCERKKKKSKNALITFRELTTTLSDIDSSLDDEAEEVNVSEKSSTNGISTSKSQLEEITYLKSQDTSYYTRPSVINVKTEKTETNLKPRNSRIKQVEFSYPIAFEPLFNYEFDKITQFENYFTCYNRDTIIKVLAKRRNSDEKKRKRRRALVFGNNISTFE